MFLALQVVVSQPVSGVPTPSQGATDMFPPLTDLRFIRHLLLPQIHSQVSRLAQTTYGNSFWYNDPLQ